MECQKIYSKTGCDLLCLNFKIMQNQNLYFVSVVVPSVNGNDAKLLLIDESAFNRLKEFTSKNFKVNAKP